MSVGIQKCGVMRIGKYGCSQRNLEVEPDRGSSRWNPWHGSGTDDPTPRWGVPWTYTSTMASRRAKQQQTHPRYKYECKRWGRGIDWRCHERTRYQNFDHDRDGWLPENGGISFSGDENSCSHHQGTGVSEQDKTVSFYHWGPKPEWVGQLVYWVKPGTTQRVFSEVKSLTLPGAWKVSGDASLSYFGYAKCSKKPQCLGRRPGKESPCNDGVY